MERDTQTESIRSRAWEWFASFVRKDIKKTEATTRETIAKILPPKSAELSALELDRPTMLSQVTSPEKQMLNEVFDISSATELLKQGEKKIVREFTLGGIPFTVSYSVTPFNNAVYNAQVRCPLVKGVSIDGDYSPEDCLMNLHGVYMGDLENKGLGSTIIRALLQQTNRVEISKIDNSDTQKIGWQTGSGDLPDYVLKNESPLAGMFGKEFICKFVDHGNGMVGIRVDAQLQKLLRAAKNFDGNVNELKNIYKAYLAYMHTPAFEELDPEAQQMCVVQRDTLAETLSR